VFWWRMEGACLLPHPSVIEFRRGSGSEIRPPMAGSGQPRRDVAHGCSRNQATEAAETVRADSPLEGDGFEPSVPRPRRALSRPGAGAEITSRMLSPMIRFARANSGILSLLDPSRKLWLGGAFDGADLEVRSFGVRRRGFP
jgi:hypothetical protein